MAISRKPKQKTAVEEPMFGEPVAQVFEDVDNEDGKRLDQEEEDRLEKLAQQLADMQNRLTEMNAVNMQLMAQPRWQSQVDDTFQPADPSKVELPDPALDPQGYDKALAERQRIRMENERRRTEIESRKAKSAEEKAAALQAAFADKYPEMAANDERMAFITSQVARKAAKRGLDVERYMLLNQPRFIEDVATEYVKVFGDPTELEDDEDYLEDDRRPAARAAPKRRANNRRRQEDDDDGRSAGIFGGTESGGRPGRGRDDDHDRGDMISDLQAMQRKTGFY